MRKITSSRLAALALAALCASGFADTIVLKNGEKLDAKITAETDTEFTLDVKVSAEITDVRTVPKSDVAKIEKEQPDEIAWQPLKNVAPGANSMPAATYTASIQALKTFTTQFPESTHTAEAQKAIAAFEEEKKRVEEGDVKLCGKWIESEDVQREKYQINASLAFNYMRDRSTRGDLVPALNTFDAIEKQFPGARIFPDAIELSRRIVATLNTEVTRRQGLMKTEMADREAGMKIASDADRLQMQTAQKAEQTSADAAIAAASGKKWPPFIPKSEKSLTALAGKLPAEITRLAAIDVAKQRESLKLANEASEAISNKDTSAADEALKKGKQLWPANELATRLQTDLTAMKATAAAKPVEAPAATPAVVKTKPHNANVTNAAAAAVQVEAPKPFLLTLGGAITVVVVLIFAGAGIGVFRKIKRKANEILE